MFVHHANHRQVLPIAVLVYLTTGITFSYAYITLLSEQMTGLNEIAHVAIVNALVGPFLISYHH
jgi:hypothetical protein